MGKFVKTAQKKTMLKVEINGTEVWATCTPAVLEFAKKTFKGGETINIQYEQQGNMPHIIRIEKGSGTDTNTGGTTATPDTTDKPKCEDCGKELKDSKYKKCYTCNKKNSTKSESYGKTPEVQESIKRQAIGHMTSRSLIALQGHLDPNNIEAITTSLYKKFQELVG